MTHLEAAVERIEQAIEERSRRHFRRLRCRWRHQHRPTRQHAARLV